MAKHTPATDVIIGNAPPERAGAASAISETGSEFGGRWESRFWAVSAPLSIELASAPPIGIPADAIDAARSTLGAAVAVADQFASSAWQPIDRTDHRPHLPRRSSSRRSAVRGLS
jgi:DHA2 family multidrug resistance protein-like MFS transporter